jgi:hypothetical protein
LNESIAFKIICSFSKSDRLDRSIPTILTLIGFAGTPPHVKPSGDTPLKNDPAPIIQHFPIFEPWCILAFIPIVV